MTRRALRAADICAALGLEFYLGPPRTPPPAATAQPRRPAVEPALALAEDPDFASVAAASTDEYQANNHRGRRPLIGRFWGLFPELHSGATGREVQGAGRAGGSCVITLRGSRWHSQGTPRSLRTHMPDWEALDADGIVDTYLSVERDPREPLELLARPLTGVPVAGPGQTC